MLSRTFSKISTINKNKKYILNRIKNDMSYKFFLKKKLILTNKHRMMNDKMGNNSALLKTYTFLKEKRNEIKEENNSLKKLYNVTKRIYHQDVGNIFFSIINHYKNKNYNITDSEIKKNIFNRSPLLLKDKELDHYYLGFKYRKVSNDVIQKQKKKHILFLNKENNNLVRNKSYFQDKNLIKKNDENNNHKMKKVFSYSNLYINNNYNKNKNIDKFKNKTNNIKKEITDNKAMIKKLIKLNNDINNISTTSTNINIQKNNNNSLISSLSDKNMAPKIQLKLFPRKKISLRNISFKNINQQNSMKQNTQSELNSKNIPSTKRSSLSEPNRIDYEKRRKIYHINIKNLIKHSNNKEFIKNLLREKNQSKFLQRLQKINILFLSQKQIEKITEYYCKTFLGFNDNQIKNILTAKNSDIDMEILHLINTFVRKNNRIKTNRNIKKDNNFLSYNIINDIDYKALMLQKTLIKNQANDD